jgi:NTE family protein
MSGPYPHLGSVRNLVFEGGGVKGIAYLGALRRLYEAIPPAQIRGVGGTSAGSIMALAVSFGLDAAGIQALANTLDYSRVPQQPGKDDFPDLTWEERDALEAASVVFGKEIWSIYGLYRRYGWYTSEYFHRWLEQTVQGQFARVMGKGTGRETFADFEKAGFATLRVKATDVSTQSSATLSLETTPDLAVADAVRMSMSIPLFFEAVSMGGAVYGDGGVISNYPMDLFDAIDPKRHFETLGFHLYAPQGTCPGSDRPLSDPPAPPKTCSPQSPITGLVSYIESLFESLTVASSIVQPADADRTIDISTYCVGTTDFSIRPKTANYNGLYNNGYGAVDAFLTRWPGNTG